jgi:hypothetical protein
MNIWRAVADARGYRLPNKASLESIKNPAETLFILKFRLALKFSSAREIWCKFHKHLLEARP